jgi:hypothetical protein
MTDDNVIPIRSNRVITTLGGSVDEVRVSLALYGEDLEPAEISGILHCEPTTSHRRGEIRVGNKTGHKTVYKQGSGSAGLWSGALRAFELLSSSISMPTWRMARRNGELEKLRVASDEQPLVVVSQSEAYSLQ